MQFFFLEAKPNFISYESVLLKPDCNTPPPCPSPSISSYKHIDDMLAKMLSDVERQERLFSLDLDMLEEEDDDSYVNTLELIPETNALIEIPVKKTPIFSTCTEIKVLDETLPSSVDVDDTDSYNLDQIKVASSESLNELLLKELELPDLPNHFDLLDFEDDDYEPIEYNPLTHVYERFDHHPERDVWFEGTYRNLSVVPEEDEDESVSLLSSHSNFRSFGSNRNSFYDSSTTKRETDSSDSDYTYESDESENIVKAEVKLLVKTSEQGKEEIEIRSVREFVEEPHKKKNSLVNRMAGLRTKFSNMVDRKLNFKPTTSKEVLLDDDKPSFTFQQVFVRTPEGDQKLMASKTDKLPLEYDPETPLLDYDMTGEVRSSINLHANIPFIPCYNRNDDLKSSTHTNPFTETVSNPFSGPIPEAYCDWLEESGGGKWFFWLKSH